MVNMILTSTGKPGEMGVRFPVTGKSGNFEQTGKVSEFYPVTILRGIWMVACSSSVIIILF